MKHIKGSRVRKIEYNRIQARRDFRSDNELGTG